MHLKAPVQQFIKIPFQKHSDQAGLLNRAIILASFIRAGCSPQSIRLYMSLSLSAAGTCGWPCRPVCRTSLFFLTRPHSFKVINSQGPVPPPPQLNSTTASLKEHQSSNVISTYLLQAKKRPVGHSFVRKWT